MDRDKRVDILNDLKLGDVILLHEDEEDGSPEEEVTFVEYDNGYDIITVENEENGVFEVDGEQFKELVRRVS